MGSLSRFGLPFVLYMERTVTWDALQKEILEKMRHLLRPGVYIQVGPPVRMTTSLSSSEIGMPSCFSTSAHGTTCGRGLGCKLSSDE